MEASYVTLQEVYQKSPRSREWLTWLTWLKNRISTMNTEKMAPTPTDYAGVRFLSKSEAVFARALDLAGKNLEPNHRQSPEASAERSKLDRR